MLPAWVNGGVPGDILPAQVDHTQCLLTVQDNCTHSTGQLYTQYRITVQINCTYCMERLYKQIVHIVQIHSIEKTV